MSQLKETKFAREGIMLDKYVLLHLLLKLGFKARPSDFSRCSAVTRCGHGTALITYALQLIEALLVLCSFLMISFGEVGVVITDIWELIISCMILGQATL